MSNRLDSAIEKNVLDSFKFISVVEQPGKLEIRSEELVLNQGYAETYIKDKQFYLAFYTKEPLNQDRRKTLFSSDAEFKIYNGDRNLIFNFKSFSNISIPLGKDPRRIECKVRSYCNEEINSEHKSFFRVIIPTERLQKPGSIFETDSVKIGGTVHFKGLLLINFNEEKYHLFPYSSAKSDKKNYLIVESLYKTNLKDFINRINTILISYAFVVGYHPRDSWHILSSNEITFKNISGIYFETLPKSLTSSYSVFPPSEYRIYFHLPHNIYFPQNAFNKLCATINGHKEFSRVLHLIVEGHTLSMELRAAIYTIALEAITNIISEENENKFIPISDKNLAKNIMKELKNTLHKHQIKIDQEGYDTLMKKLDVLNSPTNKQKLLKPFELYGIKLTQKEINCIDKRNDFLHGRIPHNNDQNTEKFILEQISLTILFCVTALVLKYSGYAGFVMYYPSLNEYSKKKNITDYLIKRI